MPLTPLKEAKPIEPQTDIECLICKRIVTYVVQELEDNRTEKTIIQELQHVCQLFPQKERQKCDDFIEQYADELIHILIEEGDPDLACTLLGVCLPKSVWQSINRNPNIEREDTDSIPKSESNSVKWTEIKPPVEVKAKNQIVCYECELLMHFIQNEIYDPNNEQQIEDFVENELCDRMQIVITKDACDNFVKTYGPTVFQLIAQKLFDPSTVCKKELKLCSNTTRLEDSIESNRKPEQDFQMPLQNQKCDICLNLVQQIDSLLEKEDFDKEVTTIVEKSCNVLNRAQKTEV